MVYCVERGAKCNQPEDVTIMDAMDGWKDDRPMLCSNRDNHKLDLYPFTPKGPLSPSFICLYYLSSFDLLYIIVQCANMSTTAKVYHHCWTIVGDIVQPITKTICQLCSKWNWTASQTQITIIVSKAHSWTSNEFIFDISAKTCATNKQQWAKLQHITIQSLTDSCQSVLCAAIQWNCVQLFHFSLAHFGPK